MSSPELWVSTLSSPEQNLSTPEHALSKPEHTLSKPEHALSKPEHPEQAWRVLFWAPEQAGGSRSGPPGIGYSCPAALQLIRQACCLELLLHVEMFGIVVLQIV